MNRPDPSCAHRFHIVKLPGIFVMLCAPFDAGEHAHCATQLSFSPRVPIGVATPDLSGEAHAVLVAPNTPHRIEPGPGQTTLTVLFDPAHETSVSLTKRYLHGKSSGVLPAEAVTALARLFDRAGPGACAALRNLAIDLAREVRQLGDPDRRRKGVKAGVDPRVAASLGYIRENLTAKLTLKDLADRSRLSPGRFQHLFKQEMGVSLRPYLLWQRLLFAVEAALKGGTLTKAAIEAGFADAPHFTRTFVRMFGFPPSILVAHGDLVAFPGTAPARTESRGRPLPVT